MLDSYEDGHRSLNVENVFFFTCTAPLSAQVDDPDFVEDAAHVFAHACETGATQVGRGGDVADHAGFVFVLFAGFPDGPAHEKDVGVVEVFGLAAKSVGFEWFDEIVEEGAVAARLFQNNVLICA